MAILNLYEIMNVIKLSTSYKMNPLSDLCHKMDSFIGYFE